MNVYAESAVPGPLAVFVVATSLVLLVTAIILCLVRAAHRDKVAARAEASIDGETRPTVEGEDVVLFGTSRITRSRSRSRSRRTVVRPRAPDHGVTRGPRSIATSSWLRSCSS